MLLHLDIISHLQGFSFAQKNFGFSSGVIHRYILQQKSCHLSFPITMMGRTHHFCLLVQCHLSTSGHIINQSFSLTGPYRGEHAS